MPHTKDRGSIAKSTWTVPSDNLYNGTQTATATTAALATQACVYCEVQNDPNSAQDLYVGGVGSQPWHLPPGGSKSFLVSNVNMIYVKTLTGTATVNWNAGD
jgi:hypothetical protein